MILLIVGWYIALNWKKVSGIGAFFFFMGFIELAYELTWVTGGEF